MDEEIRTSGGRQYAKLAAANTHEKYLAAIEADAGGFMPKGFRLDGSAQAVATIQSWSPLFKPYHSDAFTTGHRGVDIGLVDTLAGVRISLDCFDQRFMEIHHTSEDTFDKINQRELELGGASMASLVYLIATYGLDNKPSPKVVYSPTRTDHGFTFVSGQIGISPGTKELVKSSFAGQAAQVFQNIENLLRKEGLGMEDIIDATIYLTDISNYDQVNEVYAKHFTAPYPTRVCIAVKELPGGADIEVAVMAANKKAKRFSPKRKTALAAK
jgi:reactive intermediate/imine deaminase